MTLTPDALVARVRKGDLDGVVRLLSGADEPTRRGCVPAVKSLVPGVRAGQSTGRVPQALLLAQVGTHGGAAAVTTALRTRPWQTRGVHDRTVTVLLDRSPAWLPDLVRRLVEEPPTSVWDDSTWEVAEAVRSAIGLPRPTTAPYLTGLLDRLRGGWDDVLDLPAALRAAPDLVALLPAVLDLPDVGGRLSLRDHQLVTPADGVGVERVPAPVEQTWAGALVALTGAGLLDRAALLDQVLDVLLRGGRSEHVAWFLGLHARLAPDVDELALRVRSWVRLLCDGTGSSPAVAGTVLRELDEAGRLDLDTALEAATGGLARPTKALAVAQLAWLERLAARTPERRDDVLRAVLDGFDHERRDVQERALAAVRRIAAAAPPPPSLLCEVRARAATLAPTVRAEATDLLGAAAQVAVEDVPVPVGPLPPADGPVRDVGTLVEVVAHHLETGDLRAGERALDGLAAFAGRDRTALVAALAPLRDRIGPEPEHGPAFGYVPVAGLLHALVDRPPSRWGRLLRAPRSAADWQDPPGPAGCLSARAREVARHALAGRTQRLLALPASVTGGTELAVVVELLEGIEAAGAVPWLCDLEQAWLRLPRSSPDPALLTRLARLRSPGARRLHTALTGPLPEPRVRLATVPATVAHHGYDAPAVHAGAPVVEVLPPSSAAPGSLLSRATDGTDLPQRAGREGWEGERTDGLPALLALPAHREVAAAHLVTEGVWTDRRWADRARECLALLPHAEGPTGPATGLALAYASGSGDAMTRTATVDALLGFAARGGLEPAAVGASLGALLGSGAVKPGRVAPVLAEVARGPSPARRLAWHVLQAALPQVLASGRRGSADLLAVAAETAAAVGARGAMPGLDVLAAARSSTRQVVEARRLQAVLAG